MRSRGYLAAFIFFFATFCLTNCGYDTSEGCYHYDIAEQILKAHTLSFTEPRGNGFSPGPNGRFYAAHEIGNVLFYLPCAYFNTLIEDSLLSHKYQAYIDRFKDFVRSFHGALYSAITATAFMAILQQLGQPPRSAFLSTFCLAMTTYFWPYSRSGFDGVLGATLLTCSFLALIAYKNNRKHSVLVLAFTLLGLACITRLTLLLAVPSSIVYLVAIRRPDPKSLVRELILGMIVLTPFFLWLAWYRYLRTGGLLLLTNFDKYPQSPVQALDAPLLDGLSGLLFSPGKSIFVYAPLLLLSLGLFSRLYRAWRAEALYIAALIIPWLIVHAKLHANNCYGSWGLGPRYLITILPIAFIPVAVQARWILQHRALRLAAYYLSICGFVLASCSVISEWHFRTRAAQLEGLLQDDQYQFIWSPCDNQAVDMIRQGGVGNLLRCAGVEPLVTLPGCQDNAYASSTVNIWPVGLIHFGFPLWAVLPPVVLGLCLMALSFIHILRIEYHDCTPGGL